MKKRGFLFVVLISITFAVGNKLPEKFKKCKVKDSNLDGCLKAAIQDALRMIGSSGVPSLNLPSIEPVEVNYIEIGAGTSAVQLVQKYSNVKLFGISKGTVEHVHLDFDKKVLSTTLLLPHMIQKAKYEVDGKILFLPVSGKGDSDLDFKNARLSLTMHFNEEIKGGKSYFKVKSYTFRLTIEGAVYKFDNLFNGDKLLADNVLKVMNENWKAVYDDVAGGVEKTWGQVYIFIAEKVFDNVPVDDIFLQ